MSYDRWKTRSPDDTLGTNPKYEDVEPEPAMTTADQLRQIAGQDTTPPLWIYVTKDQVPVLTNAADELDRAKDERERAFTVGTLFGAFSMQGRHNEAAAIVRQFRRGR